jgi:long-subunit fatty acid transport protein
MKHLLTLLILFATNLSWGSLLRQSYEFPRATGMGNAFIALADDANAIFYNPAALARVKGVHLHLIDTGLNVDGMDTAQRIKRAVFDGEYNNLIDPDKQFLGFSFKPTLITPYFGISIYNHSFGYFDMQSLQGSTVDVFAYNDLGVALGFGIPLSQYFSFGVGLKAVSRTGMDINMTPAQLIADLGSSALQINNNVYEALKKYMGVGYGFPLSGGVLITLPQITKSAPTIRLAATVEDIGTTTFTKISGANSPTPIRMTYNFGSALQYTLNKDLNLNVTLDLRHQFESLPFVKTFHLGTELRHRFFAIRGGVYQGYPTYGASIEFPPHTRLHFSSYAVELGNKLWERGERWYQVQLVIGFSPL